MILTKISVSLDYGKKSLEKDILPLLGNPLSFEDFDGDDSRVFVEAKGSKLKVINQKSAINRCGKNAVRIYAIADEEYQKLTKGYHDEAGEYHNPVFYPHITDKLGKRLSSSFTTNMAKIVALLLSFWFMPVVNLITVPLIFGLAYVFINCIRYRKTYGRLPNLSELNSIITNAIGDVIELSASILLYSILTGATIFAPLALHAVAASTLGVGGPLFIYLLAPLLIATLIATVGAAITAGRVLFRHYFDFRLKLGLDFPFFASISLKQDRKSTSSLLKTLFLEVLKKFLLNFSTVLVACYLSFIPGGMIAGVLFGKAAAAGGGGLISKLFSLAIEVAFGMFNTIIVGSVIDKVVDKLLDIDFKHLFKRSFTKGVEKFPIKKQQVSQQDYELITLSKPQCLATPSKRDVSHKNNRRGLTFFDDITVNADAELQLSKRSPQKQLTP